MSQYWGLIPAAGIGQRMGSSVPKQFMKIGDKTLIEWTVHALAQHSQIDGIYVGLADIKANGSWVEEIHPKVLGVFQGGQSRSDTVLNGIRHLMSSNCSQEDWLLVHDSNRPLLTVEEVGHLIESVGNDPNGGIVSLPIFDTLKACEDGRITATLPRDHCFRALTPQMFKLGILQKALDQCASNEIATTDESQAMERLGYRPVLVPGSAMNIKITTPSDFRFAEAILESKQPSQDNQV